MLGVLDAQNELRGRKMNKSHMMGLAGLLALGIAGCKTKLESGKYDCKIRYRDHGLSVTFEKDERDICKVSLPEANGYILNIQDLYCDGKLDDVGDSVAVNRTNDGTTTYLFEPQELKQAGYLNEFNSLLRDTRDSIRRGYCSNERVKAKKEKLDELMKPYQNPQPETNKDSPSCTHSQE